jgi:hypothetical protein
VFFSSWAVSKRLDKPVGLLCLKTVPGDPEKYAKSVYRKATEGWGINSEHWLRWYETATSKLSQVSESDPKQTTNHINSDVEENTPSFSVKEGKNHTSGLTGVSIFYLKLNPKYFSGVTICSTAVCTETNCCFWEPEEASRNSLVATLTGGCRKPAYCPHPPYPLNSLSVCLSAFLLLLCLLLRSSVGHLLYLSVSTFRLFTYALLHTFP